MISIFPGYLQYILFSYGCKKLKSILGPLEDLIAIFLCKVYAHSKFQRNPKICIFDGNGVSGCIQRHANAKDKYL